MIDNKERIPNKVATWYKELFKVEKSTFEVVLATIEDTFTKEHVRREKQTKLSALDRLVITLSY